MTDARDPNRSADRPAYSAMRAVLPSRSQGIEAVRADIEHIVDEVEVVVVGAGLVGLTAALALARAEVSTLLVEAHRGTHDHPRARGVNTRAMEIFRELGVADDIRRAGAPLAASWGFHRGASLAETIGPMPRRAPGDAAAPPTPFSSELTAAIGPEPGSRSTLDVVEPIVLAAARRHGAQIRFATRCTSLDQHPDGVAVHLSTEDGAQKVVRTRYVINAEGAGGRLRDTLGVSVTTGRSHGHALNVLFTADLGDFVRDREFNLLAIDRPEVDGTLAAIDNDRRWVFHISYDPDRESPADYPAARCTELVRAALGPIPGPTPTIEISSVLPWEALERTADRMRVGRVFLAGDAAHQMPPSGGRGASTGITDVRNLAWKLRAVLHDQADDELLDTYEQERHPAALRAVAASGANAAAMQTTDGSRWDQRWTTLESFGCGDLYRSAAILSEPRTADEERRPDLERVGPTELDGTPGLRVPHVQLADGRSTLDAVAGRWTLLSDTALTHPGLRIVDPGPAFLARAGVDLDGAVLVRPDGHVAWRARHATSQALDAALALLPLTICHEGAVAAG